jgi:hypothetical protein
VKPASPVIPITPLVTTSAESPQAPDVNALVSYLEHDAQPMIVLDPEYHILAPNTAYRRQSGLPASPYGVGSSRPVAGMDIAPGIGIRYCISDDVTTDLISNV